MAQQYASEQHGGFVNYIRNVAIVGVSKHQPQAPFHAPQAADVISGERQHGQSLRRAPTQTGKHTVTALPRAGSSSTYLD